MSLPTQLNTLPKEYTGVVHERTGSSLFAPSRMFTVVLPSVHYPRAWNFLLTYGYNQVSRPPPRIRNTVRSTMVSVVASTIGWEHLGLRGI